MLGTSGFMDDVTFGRNWPYRRCVEWRCDTGAESDVHECLKPYPDKIIIHKAKQDMSLKVTMCMKFHDGIY